MKTVIKIVIALLILSGTIVAIHYYTGREADSKELKLYGNVDQRRVELSFIDPERISEILVEEGDVVQPGQILARQETRRLRDRIASLEAQVAVSEVVLTRLKNGSRPEDIDRAKAAVSSAEAELAFADQQLNRYQSIWERSQGAVSARDVDEMKSKQKVAQEQLKQRRKELELAEAGPRQEDIDEAQATLELNRRNLQEWRNTLADSELKSPSLAVVRSRLQEPGDMASPQRSVLSLAIISPKWVRAYIAETELGKIRPGMEAIVLTDSHPDEGIKGKVGFISSVAEFTPKTVQTEELRTSLVYEIRVYVEDSRDRLRLGMPATVVFPEMK